MTAGLGEKVIAEIKKLAGDKPIRWIVNTHVDPDHTGGNAKVAEAGESIIAGNFAGQAGRPRRTSPRSSRTRTSRHDWSRCSRRCPVKPRRPTRSSPTSSRFTSTARRCSSSTCPNAHSDGDVMVFFRKSDVLVAGDLFNTTTFPVINMEQGGSINGIVARSTAILDITVPEDKQEGGTYVIPGHGRLADEADVVEYRDMMTIIRDRVPDAIDKGMTLEQVKAARLVRDYEGRYGAARGRPTEVRRSRVSQPGTEEVESGEPSVS